MELSTIISIESISHMLPGWCWVGGNVGVEEGRLPLPLCAVLRPYMLQLWVCYIQPPTKVIPLIIWQCFQCCVEVVHIEAGLCVSRWGREGGHRHSTTLCSSNTTIQPHYIFLYDGMSWVSAMTSSWRDHHTTYMYASTMQSAHHTLGTQQNVLINRPSSFQGLGKTQTWYSQCWLLYCGV